MRKMISIILAMAMILSLSACNVTIQGAGAVPPTTETEAPAKTDISEESEAAFSEKSFPVLRDSLDSTETAKVRFYEDLPNVPYMSVTDFYNQFYLVSTDLNEGMSFEREAYDRQGICPG